MPPPLPKNPVERNQMWAHANLDPNHFGDPLEQADHLGENTQRRLALFPEMSEFLRSRFGLSPGGNHHWFPVRPLGKGGFGGVAVWEKRDAFGVVIEETAVKQSEWSHGMALTRQRHIAKEAVIMLQLNEKNSDSIVYLKGFKCFREAEKMKATWRFYFEYCPYGDLSRLGRRYKAWGTYLPEEFLWRAFHSMAVVAQVMEQGNYRDLDDGTMPRFPYTLIHSDIKPLNIFLGYNAHPNSPWHVYPVVKVGDWGLASLTNYYDPQNPARFVKNGTADYLPPESRAKTDVRKYEQWERPPFNLDSFTKCELERAEYNPDYTDRKVDSSHNVWAFGMTMHELLTHESTRTFSKRLNAMTEEEYDAWGHNTIATLRTNKEPEYSHEIRDLVRRCLNLKPSLRPTVQQIMQITGPKVEHYQKEVYKADLRVKNGVMEANHIYRLPKLYFKENEINNMPLGPHLDHFRREDEYLAGFIADEDKYAAPVWGPLLHPNRARFARRYREIVDFKKQRAEKANGKRRALDDDDQKPIDAPPAKRNRLPEPARRPANPYGRPRGLDKARAQGRGKILVRGQQPDTKPAPGRVQRLQNGFMAINTPRGQQQQRGFMAINTPRAQRMYRDHDHRSAVADSIDQALLASGPRPDSDAQSYRNVRRRRMQLWDDQVAPDLPQPMQRMGFTAFHEAADKAVEETEEEGWEETEEGAEEERDDGTKEGTEEEDVEETVEEEDVSMDEA